MIRRPPESYTKSQETGPKDPSKRSFITKAAIVPFMPKLKRLEKVFASLGSDHSHSSKEKEKQTEQIISTIFSEGVQKWNQSIGRWAKEYNFDPNVIAIIMEIESGGDSHAVSPDGGDFGLFQINIQHFQEGDDYFDVELNAQKAISLLKEEYYRAEKDLHAMFAGYNGGFMATLWMLKENDYDRDSYIEWAKTNFINQNIEEEKALELAIAKANTVAHYAEIATQLYQHTLN